MSDNGETETNGGPESEFGDIEEPGMLKSPDEMPLENPGGDPLTDHFFEISPRAVAWTAMLVAVACLTALVIVAALNSVDGLATVALALAIIAFSMQIMVFIAQERSASHQAQQAERLYADTRSLLTDIRATTNSTASMVGEQYRRVLEAALSGVSSDTDSKGSDADDRMAESLSRALADADAQQEAQSRWAQATTARTPLGPSATAVRNAEGARRARELRTFPTEDEDSREAADKLARLNQPSVEILRDLIKDEIQSLENRTWIGKPASGDDGRHLLDQGFIERFQRRDRDGEIADLERLTPLGKSAARMVTAAGEVPHYITEAMERNPAD